MPTVDFQPIANKVGDNVETQAQYLLDLSVGGTLEHGYQTGVANSVQVNKTLRQASVMTAAIANWISQQLAGDVLDDGDVAALTAKIQSSVVVGSTVDTTTTTQTANYITVSADDKKPIECYNAITISLRNLTGSLPGYLVPLVNAGTDPVVVALANAANKLNGVANGSMTLHPGQSAIFKKNFAGDGYITLAQRDSFAQGVDVASAATIDLTVVQGDCARLTGSTPVSAVTLKAAKSITLKNTLAISFINSGGLPLPGGQDILLPADSFITFREMSGVVYVSSITLSDGTSLIHKSGITGIGLGVALDYVTGNTMTFALDAAMVEDTSGRLKRISALAVTIDKSSQGANGRDSVGALANSTWAAIWAITKPDGTKAGLASASFTAPTMPSGYTYKSLQGVARVDGTGNFAHSRQRGRQWTWLSNGTPTIMASGTSGNPSTPTWVAVDVTAFIPVAIAMRLHIWGGAGGSTIVAPNNTFGDLLDTTNPPPFLRRLAASDYSYFNGSITLESNNIYWASSGAGTKLLTSGFEITAF